MEACLGKHPLVSKVFAVVISPWFANMKATSNSETEFAMGCEPTEVSQTATTTHAGFMEPQGTGVHILMHMSVRMALELGASIRGIIAFTYTSTYDPCLICPLFILTISQRQGWVVCYRSGRGGHSIAHEIPSNHPLPVPDINHQFRQLAFRRK